MVRQVTATQAKTSFLALLDEVEAGESIEVTRHGRRVARIEPAHGARSLRGHLAGVAISNADDEALFSTEAEWDVER